MQADIPKKPTTMLVPQQYIGFGRHFEGKNALNIKFLTAYTLAMMELYVPLLIVGIDKLLLHVDYFLKRNLHIWSVH